MTWRSVLSAVFPGGSKARLSILIFHRVHAQRDELFPGEPTGEEFESLVRHVKRNFVVLPLAVAIRSLRAGTLPSRALCITFDDGYADNLAVAAPILARHSAPATVFVATGFLGDGCMWNDRVIEGFRRTSREGIDLRSIGLEFYPAATIEQKRHGIAKVIEQIKYRAIDERHNCAEEVARKAGVVIPRTLMLQREDLKALRGGGVDVGAHTISHPILARLASHESVSEIADSRRELENLLDEAIPLFAYPNGRPNVDYRAEHVRMVQEAGFEAAVSTSGGSATRDCDIFQVPRFTPWSRVSWRFNAQLMRNAFAPVDRCSS